MNDEWHSAGVADVVWEMKWKFLLGIGIFVFILFLLGISWKAIAFFAAIAFIWAFIIRWLANKFLTDWIICPCHKTFPAHKEQCPKCGAKVPQNILGEEDEEGRD